ncbi:MAG: hypothetical protein NUV65_05315 [Candidatus Roizmanbacteria bacterium]|nr:hypothetical protein [Candidatus Roizmanbacteria bacterium]
MHACFSYSIIYTISSELQQLPEDLREVLNARAQQVLGLAEKRVQYHFNHTTWHRDEYHPTTARELLTDLLGLTDERGLPDGFHPTTVGVTCNFSRMTPDGSMVMLEVDTSSPYANLTVQRIGTDGQVNAMCTINRVEQKGDMGMDNAYVAEGFQTIVEAGNQKRKPINIPGFNTTFERFADLANCR